MQGGIVVTLARPGGNITGFAPIESLMVGKWLDKLKVIVSGLVRCGKHSSCQTASLPLEQSMNIAFSRQGNLMCG
jgi:hypothetical protein